jgi:hypothetical protein
MSDTLTNCQVKVSTIFVFESPQFQTAANMVYEYKKTYDAANAASGKKYQFKTDFERMQYLLGLYGRDSQGRR